jgi:hypothetical protein
VRNPPPERRSSSGFVLGGLGRKKREVQVGKTGIRGEVAPPPLLKAAPVVPPSGPFGGPWRRTRQEVTLMVNSSSDVRWRTTRLHCWWRAAAFHRFLGPLVPERLLRTGHCPLRHLLGLRKVSANHDHPVSHSLVHEF